MDPTDIPEGEHFITDWIPPSENINFEWRDSSFKSIDEYDNKTDYCIANRNESNKIQIWGFSQLPQKKKLKYVTVQAHCSFTNRQPLCSVRIGDGTWHHWEGFGNGPLSRTDQYTWEIDQEDTGEITEIQVGFNPKKTGGLAHSVKVFWLRIKLYYALENDLIEIIPRIEVEKGKINLYVNVKNRLDYAISEVWVNIRPGNSIKLAEETKSDNFQLGTVRPKKETSAIFQLKCGASLDSEIFVFVKYKDPKGQDQIIIADPYIVSSDNISRYIELIEKYESELDQKGMHKKLDTLLEDHKTIIEGQEVIKNTFIAEFVKSKAAVFKWIEESEYKLAGMMAGVGTVIENELGSLEDSNMTEYSELMNFIKKISQGSISNLQSERFHGVMEEISQITKENNDSLKGLLKNAHIVSNIILGQLISGEAEFTDIRQKNENILVGERYTMSLFTHSATPFKLKNVFITSQPANVFLCSEKVHFETAEGGYSFSPKKETMIKSGKEEVVSIDLWGPEEGTQSFFAIFDVTIEINKIDCDAKIYIGPYEIVRDSGIRKFKDRSKKAIRLILDYKETLRDFLAGE